MRTPDQFTPAPPACAAFLALLSPLAAQVSLGPAANLMVGIAPDEIAVGDVDADGDLDFVVTITSPSNGVAVWRNDGAGSFALAANVPVPSRSRTVALADFDRDGDLDLAVGGSSPPALFVLRNDGTGAFTVTTVDVDNDPRNVIAADLDRDGLPDLATANHSSRNVSIARNLGGGAFAEGVTFPVSSSVRPEWVTAADVDGDGDLDLVVAVGETPGQIAVLANNGTGSLAPAVFYATGNEPCAVQAADLDGDRAVDLITANESSGDVSLLRNLGNGTFALAQSVATGASPEALATGDFDGDGDGDVLAMNAEAGSVTVVRNQATNAATAPVIRLAGPAVLGQTLLIEQTSPTGRATSYLLLLSHAATPPTLLPDRRTIPLASSQLMLTPGSGSPFTDGFGVLDGSGTAYARLAVPKTPELSGLTLCFAFLEIDPRTPLFIGAISDASSIAMQ